MKFIYVALVMVLTLSGVQAQQRQSINQEIQALKRQVIALNRDLYILEEDLLFPTNTQVAVYLSMDIGKFFELDAIELKVDGQTVTHYLYTEKQIASLKKGGVQRLYLGNVSQGDHQVTAIIRGIGPNQREYKLGASDTFTKDKKALSVELTIRDSLEKEQPIVEMVRH
ncbi:hypothetical protein [Psychrobium sp. 1_MG-2023]|uniref:hypothetical protein n=1 Tax=Psychrobium sp. 1_MG-2023 TaxID=3062624 RepID=UPI000C336BE1|nr:hypothetical protein [Psychrobium sp. 1_MG-2023]MDP2562858.1 hypothetical protein [Psychrobium sp. 1_MG-2023]PKF53976.1 hypothetical protein CW748_17390 [Alteromonadales bacterium alter-6D02]